MKVKIGSQNHRTTDVIDCILAFLSDFTKFVTVCFELAHGVFQVFWKNCAVFLQDKSQENRAGERLKSATINENQIRKKGGG